MPRPQAGSALASAEARQASPQGRGGRLGAVGGAQLLKDHLYVVLDRVLGQAERGADLFVAQPLDDEQQDLQLTR